jgi:hypothetical protein
MMSTTLRSEFGHRVGGPRGEAVQSADAINTSLGLVTIPVKENL